MKNIYLQLLILLLIIYSCKPVSKPDGFQIEEGFSLVQVAKEPLVIDPVDLEFNEYGDALVLEMPGYPFEDTQSRIVVLKDTDQDGYYDKRIIFVENVQHASSIMPYKNGVLVAAPPYLLFVQSNDQDYKPIKVDTLLGGFSTGNLQHNYNGLILGLDNWIYAANGGNDGEPYWWKDTTSRLDLRGQDFRFSLEQKKLERIGKSSGGFGLALDNYGHIFETHNLEHISHLVFPDRYLNNNRLRQEHTLENISDHEEDGLSRIYPIGEQETRLNHPEQSGYFSGSCGITFYGGSMFGETYNNTLWVTDVVLNLIHVDKIKPNGSSFTASRTMEKRDFLASEDRSFRPVNMAIGPDGALYIVDMYRKVIEHPEWIPDDIEKTLDLNAGKNQGRIYRVTKNNLTSVFDVRKFSNQDNLVQCLLHPNLWVRKTAHRLLIDQSLSESTINELKKLLKSDNEYARLHALWVLRIKSSLDNAEITEAMKDPNPFIRENALLIAENDINSSSELAASISRMLTDSNNRVRMQACLSFSKLSSANFTKRKDAIIDMLLQALPGTSDSWNNAALTLAAGTYTAEYFSRLISSPKNSYPTDLLYSLALASSGSEGDVKTILQALAKSTLESRIKQETIKQLTLGLNSTSGKAFLESIKIMENTNDSELINVLATMRNKLNLPPSAAFLKLSKEALANVSNKSLPDSTRLQQMSMIELLPYKDKSEILFQCLSNAQSLQIQLAALRQLSTFNEKEIGKRIVNMWPELSPNLRSYARDLLLYIEIHHEALLTGLEDGTINIGEMNFDLERRRMLLWWTENDETKKRAEKLFTDSGVANRKEAIEKMKPALALQGSVDNGAKIFVSVCSSCHIYGNKGTDVGPNLTEISRKSKETLMHDILDPNAAAEPKYINHRLETIDGIVHVGIVDQETDVTITIKKIGGETVTISKENIKSLRSLKSSLMMEGLENSMSLQEMADLLAYLQKGV